MSGENFMSPLITASRCPFCHTSLGDIATVRCTACGTAYHNCSFTMQQIVAAAEELQ